MNGVVAKFVRYATTVERLEDCWAFIMSHVDEFPMGPTIEVKPVWRGPTFDDMQFDCTVAGTHEAIPDDDGAL